MRFLKYYKFETILCLIGLMFIAGWLLCFAYTLYAKIPAVFGIILQAVCIIGFALVPYVQRMKYKMEDSFMEERIKVLESTNKALNQAREVVDQCLGYNEQFDTRLTIYSRLTGSVGIPIANTLVSFCLNAKQTDTLFLIKVDLKNNWFFQIAGRPIHIEIANEMADKIKQKINDMASPTSIVFKKDEDPIN